MPRLIVLITKDFFVISPVIRWQNQLTGIKPEFLAGFACRPQKRAGAGEFDKLLIRYLFE
jgi:hypothetical protein